MNTTPVSLHPFSKMKWNKDGNHEFLILVYEGNQTKFHMVEWVENFNQSLWHCTIVE